MDAMPRVPPFDRPATYDDLVQVADVHIAEIVDGELHVTPRPAPRHAVASSELGAILLPPYQKGRGGPGGWWVLDEPELHLGGDIVVPDLAGWRRERMPRLPSTAFFPVVPDWVCEVLSPATASLDRVKKLSTYAREGVGHAWLVDPDARLLDVLRLEGGRWAILGTYSGDANVRAEPFGETNVELASLWAD